MRRPLRTLLLVALPVLATVVATSAQAGTAPSYRSYRLAADAGEPSIGWDPHAAAALYTSGTTTLRLTWDRAGRLTAKDVSDPYAVTSLDPIGFVDQATHRTFSSQLLGVCSLMAYSDDAGRTWQRSQGCGPGALLDHQTVGAGPYRAGTRPVVSRLSGYPHAVYYCAQNSYSGTCARSDDGGRTFGPGVPAYDVPGLHGRDPFGGACSAVHGHLRVAPDGVVYLPNKGCHGTPTAGNLTNSEFFGGQPAVVVSEDNGLTWDARAVPGGRNQDESDPSVAFDRSSTVYFGWQDGTNPSETAYGTTSSARVAVSRDHGRHWSRPYDVSSALGIRNVQFPEVIAGDPGRAAFAFLGTKSVGDDQHNAFRGEWHLYVATTLDGGRSWRTVDATPHDPVQRGCISLQGTSNKTVADANLCDQRNLLDFNDITVDTQGRVLVAYADGCTGRCVRDPRSASHGAVDLVARQTSGPLLYAKGSYAR